MNDSALTQLPGAVAFPRWVGRLAVGSFATASFTATWSGFYLSGFQLADMFLAVTLGIVGAMIVFGDLRFVVPRWVWPPVAALLLCVTVRSLDVVPDSFFAPRYQLAEVAPGAGVKATFWVVALVGVPVAAIACATLEPRATRWVAASFVAGVSVSSLVALSDLMGFTDISHALGYQDFSTRQTGLALHPNALGVVCVIAAPLAIYFLADSERRWRACGALILLCAGVLASGSRGAQAIFPIAVVLTLLFVANGRRVLGWLFATAAVGAVGGYLVLNQFAHDTLEELLRFGGTSATSGSDSARLILLNQALSDFRHYPLFGIGINHISEAHNIYLQLISAGGLALLVGMVAYWSGLLASCWSAKRAGQTMAPALMVSILCWLALGAIENQLTDRLLYYTVGCVAALASARAVGAVSGNVDHNGAHVPVKSRIRSR